MSIPDIRWHIFDQALQWGAEFERDPGQGQPGTPRKIEEVLEEEETQEARRTIALKRPVVTRADQFEVRTMVRRMMVRKNISGLICHTSHRRGASSMTRASPGMLAFLHQHSVAMDPGARVQGRFT